MTASQGIVVLPGATGMLGRAMAAELTQRGYEVRAPRRTELDLARPETIAAFSWPAAGRPWHIINCAAWTDVDGAEADEAAATAVNADALGELARVRGPDTVLVNFSTDYVFDGLGTAPYDTTHPRRPVNAYGRSKAAGEAVLEGLPDARWLNIRTSWLYAPWGKNFVLTMAALVRQHPEVKVVADQRGRPTSATHLARCTLDLLGRGAHGHWHVCDGGDCSWFEFAGEIARLTAAPATIRPCTTDEFPRPAKRPPYSVLDLTRTEATLGPMPHWQQNLATAIAGSRPVTP